MYTYLTVFRDIWSLQSAAGNMYSSFSNRVKGDHLFRLDLSGNGVSGLLRSYQAVTLDIYKTFLIVLWSSTATCSERYQFTFDWITASVATRASPIILLTYWPMRIRLNALLSNQNLILFCSVWSPVVAGLQEIRWSSHDKIAALSSLIWQ